MGLFAPPFFWMKSGKNRPRSPQGKHRRSSFPCGVMNTPSRLICDEKCMVLNSPPRIRTRPSPTGPLLCTDGETEAQREWALPQVTWAGRSRASPPQMCGHISNAGSRTGGGSLRGTLPVSALQGPSEAACRPRRQVCGPPARGGGWPEAWLMACREGEVTAETLIKDIWRLPAGSQALSGQRARALRADRWRAALQPAGRAWPGSLLVSVSLGHRPASAPGERPAPAQGSLSGTDLGRTCSLC